MELNQSRAKSLSLVTDWPGRFWRYSSLLLLARFGNNRAASVMGQVLEQIDGADVCAMVAQWRRQRALLIVARPKSGNDFH